MNIQEDLAYCEKCGDLTTVDDGELEDCYYCGTRLKFWKDNDLMSIKKYNLNENVAFLEMHGYYGFEGSIQYMLDCEQLVIKEYISKLPTFDEYVMYARLEKVRKFRAEQQQKRAEMEAAEANKPHCPTCNSTNIRKISTTAKLANTALFGILGTKRHKQMHCNSCGYEW